MRDPNNNQPQTRKEAVTRVESVVETLIGGRGDSLPVSAMSIDGTFPTGTAALEKRALADEIPVWDASL